MANKKTVPVLPKTKKKTNKTSPLSNENIQKFIQQGKAEKQVVTQNVGRPSHKKNLVPKTIRFGEDDYDAIDVLSATWRIEHKVKINAHSIIRALVASGASVLQHVEPPQTEEELEDMLRELFSQHLK